MSDLSFAFPADGAMLSNAAGKVTNEGLQIDCIVDASYGRKMMINSTYCTPISNQYTAKVILKSRRNLLYAVDIETGERVQIEVYYLKDAHKTYRFSLDDNIWCFQNITANKSIYKSIFEDPYLNLLKTMNDRYGTKFHMNIYYECPEFGGFNLSMMPEKYRSEWKENSNWLRLSFHANANLPDHPYIRTGFEQAKFEHDRVVEEIFRFAGKETFAGAATTIHWGDATIATVRALRSSNVNIFMGSYKYYDPQGVPIKYYLNAEQCALLNIYGFYYDKNEDVYFARYGSSIQHIPVENISSSSKEFETAHPLYSFKELCVHEQYFYPHYINYMPDYPLRFDTAIRWCVENGYKSVFLSDIFGNEY